MSTATSEAGTLVLVRSATLPLIETLLVSGDRLSLSGVLEPGRPDLAGEYRLRLHNSDLSWDSEPFRLTGSSFEIEVALIERAAGGTQPLAAGSYSLRLIDGGGAVSVFRFGADLAARLPTEGTGGQYRFRLHRTVAGNARLSLSEPLRDDELGRLAQRRLQQSFSRSTGPVRADMALFHAYLGAAATDSSRAISAEVLRSRPDVSVVWAVRDLGVEVPDGAERVVQFSRRWYDLLGEAGVVVHNLLLDGWYRKRPGQRFVQTWHGTPIKRINDSYWRGLGRSSAWIERMHEQARDWDHLVSQSPYFSEVVAGESGYGGDIIASGYPRNDALAADVRGERRAAVRRRLGLEPGTTALLWAPTWRDQLSTRAWQATMVDFLDPAAFAARLPADHVLLVRGHGHNARQGSRTTDSPRLLDVTHHPEVNDLYLASDAMITDFSSAMFDYAVTDKPLVLFAPDLEDYRHTGRGLYLDLAAEGPAPVLTGVRELADACADPAGHRLAHAERYRRFRERFVPWDDGAAARRVVDRVWPR